MSLLAQRSLSSFGKEGKYLLQPQVSDPEPVQLNEGLVKLLATVRGKYNLAAAAKMTVCPSSPSPKEPLFIHFEDLSKTEVLRLHTLLVYLCESNSKDVLNYLVELEGG